MKRASRSRSSWFRHPVQLVFPILLVIFLTAACAAQEAKPPAAFTRTQPSFFSTDTPAPETAIPPATAPPAVTMTPAGQEIQPPPAGIVFQTEEGQFITQAAGTPKLLHSVQESEVVNGLSPDNRFFLETKTTEQTLVDLQGSSRRQIWPHEGLNLCPFSWIGGQDSLLLSVLLPKGADPGFSCNLGSPVFLKAASQELIVLDEKGSGLSGPAVSPDGRVIAYNLDGAPWLYEFDIGTRQLDLSRFGVDSLSSARFADPSWSPSGRFLAWTFQVQSNPSLQGVILFDWFNQVPLILTPYEVSAHESSRPRIRFSPSENYLVLDHYQVMQGDFASHLLSIDGLLTRQLDGYFSQWAPGNDWLSLEKKPGADACRLAVESPDGSLGVPICRGDQMAWGPDGSQLISFPYNRELFWLTDLGTQKTVQIDLPAGARILRWELGEEQ